MQPEPDSRGKIQIVDDCETSRSIIKEYLLDGDLKIIMRKSAGDGVAYIKAGEPVSLVISDFQMPGMRAELNF